VVLPSEEPPKRGDHLQVFGWVTRAVNAKGDTGGVPDIESAFVKKR